MFFKKIFSKTPPKIPFPFHRKVSDGYLLCPKSEYKELFDVAIHYKSGVRIVTEILPESHSGNMLSDMSKATEEQKTLFNSYLDIIKETCKVEIGINGSEVDTHSSWPPYWKNFHFRLTRILNEEESFDDVAKQHAVLSSGMMLSLLRIVPLEEGYEEGNKSKAIINKYERNPLNRELCLSAKGCVCSICGFDFEKKYGKIGKGFIHVHHIIPVSQMGGSYVIDPINDLVPVCPNCHAMLHTSDVPLLPEELENIIKEVAKNE